MSEQPQFQAADFAQNLVFRGIIVALLALPYRWRVPLMGWLMRRVLGPVAGYRRRALDNLAMVWPDLAVSRRIEIAGHALDNAGRTMIENYSARAFKARMAGAEPMGPGLAALRAAVAEGRGVILVSGHFGNFQAIRAALLAQGHEVGALYRPMSNRYFNEHYVRTVKAMGGPIFAKGRRGMTAFMRHVKSGGITAMLFDLRAAGGVEMPFLGKPAKTALSVAEMALRFDVPMIPAYATRRTNGLDFDILFDAPIPPGTALEMTQRLTEGLEARVMANPGQWFWIHRRWK